jgi:hypothetical protein
LTFAQSKSSLNGLMFLINLTIMYSSKKFDKYVDSKKISNSPQRFNERYINRSPKQESNRDSESEREIYYDSYDKRTILRSNSPTADTNSGHRHRRSILVPVEDRAYEIDKARINIPEIKLGLTNKKENMYIYGPQGSPKNSNMKSDFYECNDRTYISGRGMNSQNDVILMKTPSRRDPGERQGSPSYFEKEFDLTYRKPHNEMSPSYRRSSKYIIDDRTIRSPVRMNHPDIVAARRSSRHVDSYGFPVIDKRSPVRSRDVVYVEEKRYYIQEEPVADDTAYLVLKNAVIHVEKTSRLGVLRRYYQKWKKYGIQMTIGFLNSELRKKPKEIIKEVVQEVIREVPVVKKEIVEIQVIQEIPIIQEKIVHVEKNIVNLNVVRPVAADKIHKALIKLRFNKLRSKLAKLPNKSLREKILKRLLKYLKRGLDTHKRLYFGYWKEGTNKFAFKKSKLAGSIAHSTKSLQRRVLSKCFNRWRRYTSEKDTFRFYKGFALYHRFLKKKVYAKIMPIDSVEGLKKKYLTGVCSIADKVITLIFKLYMKKWKEYVFEHFNNKHKGTIVKNLSWSVLRRSMNKRLLKSLNRWRRYIAWANAMNQLNIAESDKTKVFGAMKLCEAISKSAKKSFLKALVQPMNQYLNKEVKKKACLKIAKNICPKLDKLLLRRAFKRYKNKMASMRANTAMQNLFQAMFKNIYARKTKGIMRKRFNTWLKATQKDNTGEFINGYNAFRLFVMRKIYKYHKFSFKESIDVKCTKRALLNSFGLGEKFIKRHWRNFLLRWRRITSKLLLKDSSQSMFFRLLNSNTTRIRRRILIKRFNQWRRKPEIDINSIYTRNKTFCESVRKYAINNLRSMNIFFLLSHYKSIKKVAKALSFLAELASQGVKGKVKQAISKWRKNARRLSSLITKAKILKNALSRHNMKHNLQDLGATFHKWKLNCYIMNCRETTHHLLKVNVNIFKGLDIIVQFYRSRFVKFWSNFRTKTSVIKNIILSDGRANLITHLYKKYQFPKGTVAGCFGRWRFLVMKEVKALQLRMMANKRIGSHIKAVVNRLTRERVLKCFDKWKLISKEEVNYLVVTRLFDTIVKFARGYTKEAFYAILNHKNYQKLVMTLLPIDSKLRARCDKKAIAKRFNKLRDVCRNDRIYGYRALIFSKLDRLFVNRLKNIKLRCFLKWKMSGYDITKVNDGWNKLLTFSKRKHILTIADAYRDTYSNKMKKTGLMGLCSLSSTFLKQRMRYFFTHWHKYVLSTKDQGYIISKTMRSLKRIIIEKYVTNPLKNKFLKWKNMLLKGLDFESYNRGFMKYEHFTKKKHINAILSAFESTWYNQFKKTCLNKLLPHREKYFLKFLRNYFNKWKKGAGLMLIQAVNFRLLANLYSKGKTAYFSRIMNKYFKRWARREIPVDLTKVIQGENIIFSLWCRKYMTDFYSNFANYSMFKFLRSLLLKTSKFHKRGLSSYFLRWAKLMYHYRDTSVQNDLKSTIFAKTLRTKSSLILEKLIKKRFSQWRGYVNLMNKIIEKITPLADNIKKGVLKKVMNRPLKAYQEYMNKCGKMSKMALITKRTLMRKLVLAFMRWRSKLGLFKINNYQEALKKKVLNNLFNKSEKLRKLRAFIIWKDSRQIRSVYYDLGTRFTKNYMLRKLFSNVVYKIKLSTLDKRLLSIIHRLYLKSQGVVRICFNHWRKDTSDLKDHLNAKVVQDFIKDVQNKKSLVKRNNKWSTWTKNLSLIWLCVVNAVNRKTLNMLKYEAKVNKFSLFLIYLSQMNKNIIFEAFDKLKQYGVKLTNKKNVCARKLQKNIRGYLVYKNIWAVIKRLKKLRLILLMMGDKNLRYTAIAFESWRKNLKSFNLIMSAKVIQEFIQKSVVAKRMSQKQSAMLSLAGLFKNFIINRIISGIRCLSTQTKLNKFFVAVNKHISREFLSRLIYDYKIDILSKVFKIPGSVGIRILKLWFTRWLEAAGRLAFLLNRETLIKTKLTILVIRNSEKLENIHKYILMAWLRQSQKIRIEDSARILGQFVKDSYKFLNARKRWNKLAIGIGMFHGKLNGKEVIRRLRLLKAVEKFAGTVKRITVPSSWDALKNHIKYGRINGLLLAILRNYENRLNLCYLCWSLSKWLRYLAVHRQKFKAVVKMVNILHLRRLLADTDCITNAFIVKRLVRMIHMIRAKYVFDIMKQKYSKEKYQVMLISLLRRNFIVCLTDKIKTLSRVLKVCNIIKLCQRHQEVTLKKYKKEILKRWKFVLFLNQVARQKMEAIYSKIQDTYMNMASELIENEEEALLAEFEKVDDHDKVDYNELMRKTNVNDVRTTKVLFDLETGKVLYNDEDKKK